MSKKFIKSDRRSFMKGAVVAGGAAVVAPATTVASEKPELEQLPVKGSKGYKENDYVRNYYDRARF